MANGKNSYMKKIDYNNFELWMDSSTSFNNKLLIEECNVLWNLLLKRRNPHQPGQPGVQIKSAAGYFPNGEVQKVVRLLTKEAEGIYSLYSGNTNIRSIVGSWIYISSNENKYTGWHTHESLGINTHAGELIDTLDADLTAVYYAQVPEIEDEGFIQFASTTKPSEKDRVLQIKPKAGDYFVFDKSLPHRPTLNEKSKNIRYVIAATMKFLDCDLYSNSVTYSKTLV